MINDTLRTVSKYWEGGRANAGSSGALQMMNLWSGEGPEVELSQNGQLGTMRRGEGNGRVNKE